ncbi:Y box binding protein 1 [Dissophora globulifera]|uniref:Y box binding protein 1 n=1 Tax=Dissophora globulifera TaxID=979702 RepID=A0A9P6RNP3_9FUNG|nr:Y box binding protein 1 [Dissophora globulifera]
MSAPAAARRTGRVKFFNSQKGFGFIIPSESSEANPVDEIFVHHTAIHNDGGFKSLAEGEDVEYDIVHGPKGLQAANVTGPNGVSVRGDTRGYGNGRFGGGGYGGGYGGFGGPNAYGGGYGGGMGNAPYGGQGAGGQQGYGQGYQQHGFGGQGFQQGNNQFPYGYPQGGYGGANAGLQGQMGQQPNAQPAFGQPYGSNPGPQASWNTPTPGACYDLGGAVEEGDSGIDEDNFFVYFLTGQLGEDPPASIRA